MIAMYYVVIKNCNILQIKLMKYVNWQFNKINMLYNL
jgi:hypothetical protein